MDIPRIFNITESAHRIHNPITADKLATLGAALRLEPGARVLDLGSGSGEMLCTWARDHGIVGTGIDMSRLFSQQAKRRADELGVQVRSSSSMVMQRVMFPMRKSMWPLALVRPGLPGELPALSSFWREACVQEESFSLANPTGEECRHRKKLPGDVSPIRSPTFSRFRTLSRLS